MEAVTHLEKVIIGEVSAVTHLEKVIAQETSAVTYTEKVIAGEATPITHLQKVIAGVASPVTHLEQVWAGSSPTPSEHEYTGAVPVTITANGTPLLDYLISGNEEHTGTPTPDNPIMPQGTGERTGNLFDMSDFSLLQVTSTAYRYGTSLGVLPQGAYTFNATKSAGAQSIYLTAKLNGAYSQTTISSVPFSFTADGNSEYIIRNASNTGTTWEAENYSDMMLNEGSTPLPYEPYGYKIPISSAGQTTPVYLGEVQTTRRIKKLVLTGEEFVYVYANADIAFRINSSDAMLNYRYCVCTHFAYQRTPGGSKIDGATAGAGDYNLYFTFSSSSAAQFGVVAGDTNSFKAYLAQQYAAGTPVTIWYVLATPETAVVNEPLRKIGDYADTLSMEQAGVQIPTLNGQTVFDVDTTLKPSEVYIKYKG